MTRPQEIKRRFEQLIDKHLLELVSGKADRMMEIEDFAAGLFIHPTHLGDTIKSCSGTSACGIYQIKILQVAQQLLSDDKRPVRDIAFLLTYDPSQFTKWFKRVSGITPRKFRNNLKQQNRQIL